MRICKVKATDRIIEMQSDATEGTLISNALIAGYAENEVEELVVTNQEYILLINTQEENDKTYADRRKLEYPSYADQLDDIYHNGIDGWKATIKVTKDKYPKG